MRSFLDLAEHRIVGGMGVQVNAQHGWVLIKNPAGKTQRKACRFLQIGQARL
jgi:hypothetical protein